MRANTKAAATSNIPIDGMSSSQSSHSANPEALLPSMHMMMMPSFHGPPACHMCGPQHTVASSNGCHGDHVSFWGLAGQRAWVIAEAETETSGTGAMFWKSTETRTHQHGPPGVHGGTPEARLVGQVPDQCLAAYGL